MPCRRARPDRGIERARVAQDGSVRAEGQVGLVDVACFDPPPDAIERLGITGIVEFGLGRADPGTGGIRKQGSERIGIQLLVRVEDAEPAKRQRAGSGGRHALDDPPGFVAQEARNRLPLCSGVFQRLQQRRDILRGIRLHDGTRVPVQPGSPAGAGIVQQDEGRGVVQEHPSRGLQRRGACRKPACAPIPSE